MPSLLDGLTNARREVRFWRCADERAQAFNVAADIEQLIGGRNVAPRRIAVLVQSMESESRPVAGALRERAIPHRLLGTSAFFERAEVRDALAWLRLLLDPGDAGAVVRALVRAPIELRQVDVARVVQVARRRKLELISACRAAIELPQIPPEAQERLRGFLELHRELEASMQALPAQVFLENLISRIGLREGHSLTSPQERAERLASEVALLELAAGYLEGAPGRGVRELAAHLIASARGAPSRAGAGDDGERPLRWQTPAWDSAEEGLPGAVHVMGLTSTPPRQFDHIYLVGLHSAPVPAGERLDAGEAIIGAARSARDRLILAYPASSPEGELRAPAAVVEDARLALGAEWEDRSALPAASQDAVRAAVQAMRKELLDGVARIGGRLGELRLDTDLDISHGVVRYLELIKLVALLERPESQSLAEALADVNARLLAAATPLQREILETSTLDETLLASQDADRGGAAEQLPGGRPGLMGGVVREERSLESFLPRRGAGLLLSASDVETYRSCPLRYKFARVLKIPAEPTLSQRFGIVVHQVLERYHASGAQGSGELVLLLEQCSRRAGIGAGERERALLAMAREALGRYHRELAAQEGEPVWFERSFSFELGPHRVRGRVDRIDRLADGTYELVDYKTGRAKDSSQLSGELQLSLYALAARESWHLDVSRLSYHYVLDAKKVQVPRDCADLDWVQQAMLEAAEAIIAERFEATPSQAACSVCDYRIVCPAAEP